MDTFVGESSGERTGLPLFDLFPSKQYLFCDKIIIADGNGDSTGRLIDDGRSYKGFISFLFLSAKLSLSVCKVITDSRE